MEGGRVLRRVLRRDSKRDFREGTVHDRNTPFRGYDPA